MSARKTASTRGASARKPDAPKAVRFVSRAYPTLSVYVPPRRTFVHFEGGSVTVTDPDLIELLDNTEDVERA